MEFLVVGEWVFVVEVFLKWCIWKGCMEYFVKWKGWLQKYSIWELEENILDVCLFVVFEEREREMEFYGFKKCGFKFKIFFF